MNLEKVFKTRKSTRKFSGLRIDPEIIAKGVAYGQKAPSAGALRAYKFVAIAIKEKIEQITGVTRQKWIKDAGLIVVICVDPEKSATRYGNRGRSLYSIQDATLFGSHLDLYFVSQGLGTCWVGSFNEEKIKKLLKLDLRPISLLVVGHKVKE